MWVLEDLDGFMYERFPKFKKPWNRGAVRVKGLTINGYPKIPRTLTFEGLKKVGYMYVEEKIDGYNVRVVNTPQGIFAFTRSGIIDPFATEKARELFSEFFKDNPNLVICSEFIGNTPFTQPISEDWDGDVEVYVFDLMTPDGNFINVKERRRLLEEYNILQAPLLYEGEFNREKLEDIFLSLHEKGREGMVFKSDDRRKAVKLVTPSSDAEDVVRAYFLFDTPARFIEGRLWRSALISQEIGISFSEVWTKAMEEFFNRVKDSVKEGKVVESFKIYVKNLSTFHALHRHLLGRSREIYIQGIKIDPHPYGYCVRFEKLYKKTNKYLQRYLNGGWFTD